MTYVAAQDSLDGIAKVIYESKDGKTFEALDWLFRGSPISPIKGNRWFAITDFTLINRVVYGKRPLPMIKSLH
jgi:hypothetical protein